MNTKYIRITAILIALGIAGGIELRADQNDTYKHAGSKQTASPQDQKGQLKEAAEMNLVTIRLAELASQKAQNDELKRFAKTLEQDHRQAQSDLQRIAQKQNATLPTMVSSECEEKISHLQSLQGSEFDREFAKGAVEGHAMAIAKLNQTSPTASGRGGSIQSSTSTSTDSVSGGAQPAPGADSADLQQYQQRMLAKMKEHQNQARQVARAVGLDQATITSLESKANEGVGSPGSNVQSSTGKDNTSTYPKTDEQKENSNSSSDRIK